MIVLSYQIFYIIFHLTCQFHLKWVTRQIYAYDNIKGNLPTTLCAGITLLDSKHSQITRNQKGNQVDIPTVRTKTSGTNSIKITVNSWNDLNKLFIKKQFVNQKINFCKSLQGSLIKSYFIKRLYQGLGFLFFSFSIFIYF